MAILGLLSLIALVYLLCVFEVDPRAVADPPDTRSQPRQTPPEIRRKIAEKEAECRRLYAEYSKDGRVVTDEEFTRLETMSAEIVGLQRQLAAAERWGAVDAALGHNQVGSGRIAPPMDTMPHSDTANTRNGRHQYSMLKAFRSRMDPSRYPLDGIEKETHDEMLKERQREGLKTRGILIPLDLPVDLSAAMRYAERTGSTHALQRQLAIRSELRALDTAAGAGSIPTILSTNMIDILRARLVTMKLGARAMFDMQGKFAIPRQKTASTFYMVTEGQALPPSNQTIDQVAFSPHTGGVNTTYTRQFLEQTNQDAEQFVREDQIAVVARGVESVAFTGQGSAGYPLGLFVNPQIVTYVIGTNGGAPTWAMLVALESYVAYYNADVGSLGYVTTALMRGTLKTTLKVAGSTFAVYLWGDAPAFPLNGYPALVSNLIPGTLAKGNATGLHAIAFGNWEDMIYAFWSGMDTIVDPYTLADSGGVRIVTMQDFDVNIRHPESFATCVDMVSSIAAPV